MAGLRAVIAREVKKEICGNNKPSENTLSQLSPAAASQSVRTAGFI